MLCRLKQHVEVRTRYADRMDSVHKRVHPNNGVGADWKPDVSSSRIDTPIEHRADRSLDQLDVIVRNEELCIAANVALHIRNRARDEGSWPRATRLDEVCDREARSQGVQI